MVSEVTPSSNIAAGITSNTDLDPHSMYMYYCNAYREKIRTNISIRVLPNPTLFYLVLLVVLLGMFLQKPNRFDREQQKRHSGLGAACWKTGLLQPVAMKYYIDYDSLSFV